MLVDKTLSPLAQMPLRWDTHLSPMLTMLLRWVMEQLLKTTAPLLLVMVLSQPLPTRPLKAPWAALPISMRVLIQVASSV
ncbi:hypothetical protein LMG33818_002656 [Halomonadaceae bacterium LMG 33818]